MDFVVVVVVIVVVFLTSLHFIIFNCGMVNFKIEFI